MFDPSSRGIGTRYAARMHNNNDNADNLYELADDLNEICASLDELCVALQGGGIVQARDIEPSLASAVPKLRRAVATLNDASAREDRNGRDDGDSATGSPRLM